MFRSPTIGSGVTYTRSVSSTITITIPSGSTFGMNASQTGRIAIIAIDNGGSVILGAVGASARTDEGNVISPTAISGSATSASTYYSSTAVTGPLAYRIVGYVDAYYTGSGVWQAVSVVQGAGGNSLSPLAGIGNGQTWQDVKTSRTAGTVYYNTTGKPIMVSIKGALGDSVGIYSNPSGTPTTQIAVSDGYNAGGGVGSAAGITAIIPPNWAYKSTSMTIALWMELS